MIGMIFFWRWGEIEEINIFNLGFWNWKTLLHFKNVVILFLELTSNYKKHLQCLCDQEVVYVVLVWVHT